MRIDRIEIRVTDLTTRLRRQRSTGSYDTGAPGTLLGKPVLVKIFAENRIVVSNRHDGLRISFHFYNTLEDVQAVLELLEKNINLLVTSRQLSTAAKQ